MNKKIINVSLGLIALASTLVIAGCGDSAPAVEVDADMQSFVSKITGTSSAVSSALKEFGANDTVANDDMGMYDLKDPKVTAKEGTCYTMEASAGVTTREYSVCWEANKINKIEFKQMK